MAGNSNGARSLPGEVTERTNAFFPLPQLEPSLEAKKKPQPPSDSLPPSQEWQNLVGALRLNRRRLLRMPGVIAVDVGYKIKGEYFTNTLALRVHVERKHDDAYFESYRNQYLSQSDKVAEDKRAAKSKASLKRILVPEKVKDPNGKPVTIDIVEAAYRPAALPVLPRPGMVLETPVESVNDRRRCRLDPLVGGISIGSPHTSVGTLGALVWDKTDGSICILSNWHVLAGHMHAELGNPCFQPGPFDRGRSCDVVARLKRWSFDCHTDAALAELTGSRHYCAGEIVDLPRQISGVKNPHLGMAVRKSGRSTGDTWGFVDGLYFSSAIQYSNGMVQVFEDQIHIAPLYSDQRISEPGDSGSVWVTDANGEGYQAVGLHFGGDLLRSAFGEYAIANPMTTVAERLNFSFRPLFLEIRDESVVSLPMTSRIGNEIGNGNGGRPIGILLDGLTGSGGQTPEQITIGGGGSPGSGT